MKLMIVLLSIALTGCGTLGEAFNDVMYDLGGYGNRAPTLSGTPTRNSNCDDSRCRTLDSVAARGYELARQQKITWVRLVDAFYQKRTELYPNSDDRFGAREMILYQKALAEQMDIGKISEAQWAYLIEKKTAEITAQNNASTPQQRTCKTTNIGTRSYPEYKTICN